MAPHITIILKSQMDKAIPFLSRIAEALERINPPIKKLEELPACTAFLWHAESHSLQPVEKIAAVGIELLKGVDQQKEILLVNTRQFAQGLPANNALLWGARGMGKSSLIKAIHQHLNNVEKYPLTLVEINREDIPSLPLLLRLLRTCPRRFVLFCDDLSFARDESMYKSLKAVLEGGLEGRPTNVLFYATSNRRHLMPREMIENENSTAINPSESVEEKVSLSDRFGLWLGFHSCDQNTYFEMVDGYSAWLNFPPAACATLHAEANEWAITRGARSGRVAWQFIQDKAGKLGLKH